MKIDNSIATPPSTLYNLLTQLSFLLDNRYIQLRLDTRYRDVRRSDARVFIQVARRARGETEIAQEMNVTRQAVQASVKRLKDFGLVEIVPMPNNGRNKIVQLTQDGIAASAFASDLIRQVEAECAAIIGAEELERLRGLLMHLVTGYKSKHYVKLPVRGPDAEGDESGSHFGT